jgi:hypothetical protein
LLKSARPKSGCARFRAAVFAATDNMLDQDPSAAVLHPWSTHKGIDDG